MIDAQEVINAFQVFDPEGTGKVSSEELVLALTTMGEMSTDKAEKLIEDAGGKSKFDYTKFVHKMNEKAKG
eukprot:CAMPEP_0201123608 /NCGR_PEP_ID=MMETSP0850-20130426/8066_1 /ASSEMBLY_ACC=CAM_ASM_000622 /TAXON_ID=183588 /ORGANISM="Pseudo-nitzschia fraudulenta, Strain WWA7" /LENGTH=70 /DNA_ID=CAMNT_0047390605 /DNA_START=110 /DNA_END=322 /DNA_ORIENTATION=+